MDSDCYGELMCLEADRSGKRVLPPGQLGSSMVLGLHLVYVSLANVSTSWLSLCHFLRTSWGLPFFPSIVSGF